MTPQFRDYVFVGIQFILFIVFLLDIRTLEISIPLWFRYCGVFLIAIGLAIIGIALIQFKTKLSPFPTPKKGSTLIKTGIFTWIRHPIYAGIILGFLGLGIYYYQSPYKIGITALLFILFYYKSSYEELRLETVFTEYKTYKTKTKRFFPFIF